MDLEEHTRRAARIGEQQSAQARAISRAAGSTFARLTRQNYALMGDIVDFTLAQMRLPVAHTDAREMLEQQSADARTLVSKARERAGEYADIVGEMRNLAMSTTSQGLHAVEEAAEETVKRAASRATDVTDAAAAEPTAGGKPAFDAKTAPQDAPAERAPRTAAHGPATGKQATTTAKASATAGKTASKATGKTASKATGKTASKATGKTASKAAGKTASKATGKTASKATGKTASKAAGKTASKAAGKAASKAAGKTVDKAGAASRTTGKPASATKRTAGEQGTNKGATASTSRAKAASARKG